MVSPLITTLALTGLLSLFDQQADLLLPTTMFKGTSAKGEVNIKHTFYKELYSLQNMDQRRWIQVHESPDFKSNSK